MIEGQCYGPGEQSAHDRCLVCRPKGSRTAFSVNEGLRKYIYIAY